MKCNIKRNYIPSDYEIIKNIKKTCEKKVIAKMWACYLPICLHT